MVNVDEFLTPTVILWFTFIGSSYYDIMHFNKKPFYLKGGLEEDSKIMDAYLMHSVYTWFVLFLIHMYTISTSNVVYLVLHGGVGLLILLLLFSAVISCMIKWSDHFVQLNHIFKSRDLIVKNERKLAKSQESVESKTFNDDAYRDRGFTRPKVHSSVRMPCSYGIETSSSLIVALVAWYFHWSLITYLWLGIQCLIV